LPRCRIKTRSATKSKNRSFDADGIFVHEQDCPVWIGTLHGIGGDDLATLRVTDVRLNGIKLMRLRPFVWLGEFADQTDRRVLGHLLALPLKRPGLGRVFLWLTFTQRLRFPNAFGFNQEPDLRPIISLSSCRGLASAFSRIGRPCNSLDEPRLASRHTSGPGTNAHP
jgi:hypothetical protein